MSHPLAAAAVLAALGVLLGCGGSTGGPVRPAPLPSSSAPTRQTVEIRNYTYAPQKLSVPVGTTVTWVQDDSTVHTVTDPGVFDSGSLSRGQRYSYTFRTPGSYGYRCTIHPSMRGTVTVQ